MWYPFVDIMRNCTPRGGGFPGSSSHHLHIFTRCRCNWIIVIFYPIQTEQCWDCCTAAPNIQSPTTTAYHRFQPTWLAPTSVISFTELPSFAGGPKSDGHVMSNYLLRRRTYVCTCARHCTANFSSHRHRDKRRRSRDCWDASSSSICHRLGGVTWRPPLSWAASDWLTVVNSMSCLLGVNYWN